MPDVFQGSCSLCLHPALYEVTDAGKYKWFRCDTCKGFLISDRAEKEVAKSSPELRQRISQQSSSLPDDKVLRILVSAFLPDGRPGPGLLETEIEAKSMWLQRSSN
jgi:hypothetical protein